MSHPHAAILPFCVSVGIFAHSWRSHGEVLVGSRRASDWGLAGFPPGLLHDAALFLKLASVAEQSLASLPMKKLIIWLHVSQCSSTFRVLK